MPDSDPPSGTATEASSQANHRYYFDTGVGYWSGVFTFRITNWQAFRKDRIGPVNRFLVLSMALTMWVFDRARITSVLKGDPDKEPAGVVTNEVRITLFGITLYLLIERYLMHPDGRGVTVDSRERFGPVPCLFTVDKVHPAEVVDGGKRAIYYMPLLGTDWVGKYRVTDDGDRIESVLSCDWAQGTEVIERVG
jgi:hypothetical protein